MIAANELREILAYDAATGLFTWRAKGLQAGGRALNGYITISINYRRYYAHRLAWLYTTGDWPVAQIDHIDGDRANNRLSNLRAATTAENTRNSRAKTRRPDGLKGIYLHRTSGLWAATIMTDGTKRSLGYFKTAEEAHAAYAAAAERDHRDFARTK